MPLKTRQQIRDEFAANGVSYSAWARQRGYSPNMVIAIVNDDDRILIESQRRAVLTVDGVVGSHHHGFDDLSLLDRRVRDGRAASHGRDRPDDE